MRDLPEQGQLQQRNAKPVSGEHLELLGKTASLKWSNGEFSTLTEAVVETIKHAGLVPEQVKRVIEFANTDAYLREFRKEGSHKVVHFPGGPANPTDVFNDLNDGGGGTVFDSGMGDYNAPPIKKASVDTDAILKAAFATSEEEYPAANPLGELDDLRVKVGGALDLVNDSLGGLEGCVYDLEQAIYHQVKQAALNDYSLGQVVQVMSAANPSEAHIKVAFEFLTERLLQEGVFSSPQSIGESLSKVAAHNVVNKGHTLVGLFSDYCETITKVAELRIARQELDEAHENLTAFILKQAKALPAAAKEVAQKVEKGLIPRVLGATRRAGEAANPVVNKIVGHLTGHEDVANAAGNIAHKAIQYAPHAAAVIGANEIRRQLKYSPAYNKVMGVTVPMSDAYNQREAEIAAANGRYPEY